MKRPHREAYGTLLLWAASTISIVAGLLFASGARIAGAVLAPALLLAAGLWPALRAAPPPTALGLAAFAALLWAMGLAGWRLAGLCLPESACATRVSGALVAATALVTVPLTLLGHWGWLQPGWFLAWAAAVAVGAALLPPTPLPRAIPPPAATGEGRRGAWRRIESALAYTVLAALAVTAAVEVHANRFKAPGHFGFDDKSYHLSTVATWRDEGNLDMLRFGYGDRGTSYYPVVGELLPWAALAPFGDNDLAARWTQLPFALGTLPAMLALAGWLGLRRRAAAPALALYWSLDRVFPVLALGAGNDHATAFFFLATADGLLRLVRRRSRGSALYAGTAVGLLVGTKYLALYFVPLLGVVYGAAWLGRERTGTREGASAAARLAPEAIALAAAAVAGGTTYLRNAVATGNPVFPVPLTIGGRAILPGWEEVTLAWRRVLPEFAIAFPDYFLRQDLWGPLASWLLVPAALLAPLAALAGRRGAGGGTSDSASAPRASGRAIEAALLAIPVAMFLIFLYQIHDHRDMRYILPGVALAALAWAYLTRRVGEIPRRWGPPAACCLAAVAYAAVLVTLIVRLPPDRTWQIALWPPVALAVGAAIAWRRGRAGRPAGRMGGVVRRRIGRGAMAASGVGIFALTLGTAERYPERKLTDQGAFSYLDGLTRERGGATIAYEAYNSPYLLWGSRLQNRVVVVPTVCDPETRLFRWGQAVEEPPWPYGIWQRERCWLGNVETLEVDYVFVVKSGAEDQVWRRMARRPERFRWIYDDPHFAVWEVVAQSPRR